MCKSKDVPDLGTGNVFLVIPSLRIYGELVQVDYSTMQYQPMHYPFDSCESNHMQVMINHDDHLGSTINRNTF